MKVRVSGVPYEVELPELKKNNPYDITTLQILSIIDEIQQESEEFTNEQYKLGFLSAISRIKSRIRLEFGVNTKNEVWTK